MDARIPLIVPQLHLGPHIDLLLDLLIDLLLLLLVLLLVVLNRAVELRRTRIGHRRNVSFVVFTTDNEATLAGSEPLRVFLNTHPPHP